MSVDPWREYQQAVIKQTFCLFTLLRGRELVYEQDEPFYGPIPEEKRPWSGRLLRGPSYLDTFPQVMGSDILDLLGRDGEVEQLAFKGWMLEVYRLWDVQFRADMEDANREAYGDGNSKIMPPELTVMGDFRLIRNDLVHNRCIASEEQTGRCEILTWFKPGDRIVLNTSHVLAFLHQLGVLEFGGYYVPGGEMAHCTYGTPEMLRRRSPAPKIVSVRTDLETHSDTREIWILISLAFDNGFVSKFADSTGIVHSDEEWRLLMRLAKQASVTPDGDIDGPLPWLRAKAQEVYHIEVDTHDRSLHGEQPSRDFPQGGFSGPRIRFRQ